MDSVESKSWGLPFAPRVAELTLDVLLVTLAPTIVAACRFECEMEIVDAWYGDSGS